MDNYAHDEFLDIKNSKTQTKEKTDIFFKTVPSQISFQESGI